MTSVRRWINNGLPRKGWIWEGEEDLGRQYGRCEWCHSGIRYAQHLRHSEAGEITICGSLCAEHLTQKYVKKGRIHEKS